MPSRNLKGRLLRWQISYDKRVSALKTWQAKLLYTWIIPSLDNLGRMEGEPRIVRAMTFPYEKVTDSQIAASLQDIHNKGLLFWYNINGEKYLQCPTLEKNIFFRIGGNRNRQSDYPEPLGNEYKEWLVKTRQDTSRRVGVDLDKDKDKDKEVDKKTRHLEFVLLTAEEHQKLVDRYGKGATQGLIERLNNYIGSKGKQYKSHYHTILTWADKDKPQKTNMGGRL